MHQASGSGPRSCSRCGRLGVPARRSGVSGWNKARSSIGRDQGWRSASGHKVSVYDTTSLKLLSEGRIAGKRRPHRFPDHAISPVLCFSPDGRVVVTACFPDPKGPIGERHLDERLIQYVPIPWLDRRSPEGEFPQSPDYKLATAPYWGPAPSLVRFYGRKSSSVIEGWTPFMLLTFDRGGPRDQSAYLSCASPAIARRGTHMDFSCRSLGGGRPYIYREGRSRDRFACSI